VLAEVGAIPIFWGAE